MIANSRMVADRNHPLARFPGRKHPHNTQRDRRRDTEHAPSRPGDAWKFRNARFACCLREAAGKERDSDLPSKPSNPLAAARSCWWPVGEMPHRYRSAWPGSSATMDELSALFSAADVFTLPTIYDPFSNACLEASRRGLPVVTTTANGFSEILKPGLHGEIVEPGDVNALAGALDMEETGSRKTSQAAGSWQKAIRSSGMSRPRSMSRRIVRRRKTRPPGCGSPNRSLPGAPASRAKRRRPPRCRTGHRGENPDCEARARRGNNCRWRWRPFLRRPPFRTRCRGECRR